MGETRVEMGGGGLEAAPGLIGLAVIQAELSALLDGRAVDLRTQADLSRYFRAEVLATATEQYAA